MTDSYFLHRLESVRGIAALMVAVSHALIVFQMTGFQDVLAGALTCLGSGWAAVTMFFVLSGHVLGLAVRRAQGDGFTEFIRYSIRRIFRIYPAFAVSTLLILTWMWGAAQLSSGTALWFNHSPLNYHHGVLNSDVPLTLDRILRNLFFQEASFNLVTWTLKVEMICSLLLPPLHILVRRLSLKGKVVVLFGLISLAGAGKWFEVRGQAGLAEGFQETTLPYLFLFYLGYLLPDLQPRISPACKENRRLTAACTLGALTLFFASSAIRTPVGMIDDLRVIQGLAAAAILGGLLYGSELAWFRLLDHPVVRFYGRISYSFYLLHDLMLIVLARCFAHWIPGSLWQPIPLLAAAVLFVASVGAVTPLAWLFYRRVEQPFIQYSKKLCQRVFLPKHPVSSPAQRRPLPLQSN